MPSQADMIWPLLVFFNRVFWGLCKCYVTSGGASQDRTADLITPCMGFLGVALAFFPRTGRHAWHRDEPVDNPQNKI